MTFVAMVNAFRDTELLQCQNTADTQQDLLLETILPVTAIERVGDGFVELGVHLVVRIEQIQLDAAYIDTPHIGMHLIVHVGNVHDNGIAVGVKLPLYGKRVEVLRVVLGYLLAVHAQALREVAETIEETDGAKVYIAVRCLFQIVAGEHAETA